MMAVREKFPFTRVVVFDGVLTSVTIDFTEDIRATPVANPSPQVIFSASGGSATDSNDNLIPFTTTLSGKKVTWTFDSPPRTAQGALGLAVELLFASG
jgi:hypothetical protein